MGSDNVDRWSEQRIWDAVLENVRIVVSTHGVLADALSHGFVRIEELALLVFDEGMSSSYEKRGLPWADQLQPIIARASIPQIRL